MTYFVYTILWYSNGKKEINCVTHTHNGFFFFFSIFNLRVSNVANDYFTPRNWSISRWEISEERDENKEETSCVKLIYRINLMKSTEAQN